ncbi:MAG TPA: secondary thiamine-phosphate synthase enzyme YjbQ [Candidatus Krumholzibacteria bacterium]|nr:secondary thiamine-phosphate synthase enzyme YjbQ [Candidatus Krumholzibacteria bacterium]HPD72609.1 secondary thiamine-phosphate synthase enzyme YjbQ [Candidatus Krumholzibacteria bacterium]HRY40459.1 secondary thiamine-phosphate synthase enzyme YjbQ [Candidatus Krumholzibacteria bacterium]
MFHGEYVTRHTRGFSDVHDLTNDIQAIVERAGVGEGSVTVFAVGSTASITTLEFEPALVRDLAEALEQLWPRTMRSHHSQTWGDDNGFSHLRASILGPSVVVPVHGGEIVLGTWQQIVLVDHDNRPRERRIFVQVAGDAQTPGAV